jgi:hypothetical protein
MQELRFIKKQPPPDTLTHTTDTLTPQTIVPIFFIHDGDKPFCCKPGCFCMRHDQELETLLRAVIRGEMHIRQVSCNPMQ